MTHRPVESFEIAWQGISLTVTYEQRWLDSEATSVAHLQIKSATRERLPITATGYRSHFAPAAEIDEAGGPVAFVVGWLDGMAKSAEWKQYAEASRQLSLF